MKLVKLIHNSDAGIGKLSKKTIISKIKSAGFDCSYSSTKSPLVEGTIPDNINFIAVAGGDGTVRLIADYLLRRNKLEKQFAIGIIPSGTANNIADTLGITGTEDEIIQHWKIESHRNFDVGKISGLKECSFLLEGLGYGIFPKVIKQMKKRKWKNKDGDGELKTALQHMLFVLETYKPKYCKIEIDGVDFSGSYLMVEVLNIKSFGPRLNLAVTAEPDDGKFDVILISESDRNNLQRYIQSKVENQNEIIEFKTIKGSKIKIEWPGKWMHVDDQLIASLMFKPISIEVINNALTFLI